MENINRLLAFLVAECLHNKKLNTDPIYLKSLNWYNLALFLFPPEFIQKQFKTLETDITWILLARVTNPGWLGGWAEPKIS